MSVAGLDLLLLAAGYGVLAGCGLVRRLRDALRLAGLAFVLGFAAVGTLLSFALAAGAGETTWLVVALGLATLAAGAAAARAVRPRDHVSAGERRGRWVALGAAVVGLAYLAWILRSVHAAGASTAWDAWSFWIPKARSIVAFGGLDTGVGGFTSFANPDYPPLLPAFYAAVFRFAGAEHASLLPVQQWLLLAGFLWGAAGLLLRRVPAAVVSVALLLLLLAPDVGGAVADSLADLPLALELGTATVCLGLWLVEREPRLLVPAAVALAGAAMTKKEGTALALLLLAVAALARWSLLALLPLAAVAVAPVASRLAWGAWLSAHHVATSGDYRLSDLVDPGYLSGRWGRLGSSAYRVPQYLFDVGRWEAALPLALLVALLARRRVSAMLLAFVVLALLGLVAIYWISFLPLEFHLATSAARTVLPVVVVGASLLPLVLAEAAARRE